MSAAAGPSAPATRELELDARDEEEIARMAAEAADLEEPFDEAAARAQLRALKNDQAPQPKSL